MDKEEKELQIKLAKLQADIQIWLTASFAFLALLAGSVIAAWQFYFSPPTDPAILKSFLFDTFVVIAVAFAVLAVISVLKMESCRDQMDNL